MPINDKWDYVTLKALYSKTKQNKQKTSQQDEEASHRMGKTSLPAIHQTEH